MENISTSLTPKRLRQFGITTGGIFVVLFGVTFPFIADRSWPVWPWAIAGAFWLIAFIQPIWLKQFYRYWMKLGNFLGKINTFILLSIMYGVLFIPIGLISRLLKRDPLCYQANRKVNSYRNVVQPREKNHIERPF